MKLPSTRQTAILAFIHEHDEEKGYPPTVREIGAEVELKSPSTVHTHLAKLEAGGFIKWDAKLSRTIQIMEPGREYLASVGRAA